MLAQFIRAQLTLAALSFVVYTSFLGAMRVPYALMLGTAGGAMEFVPVAGPLFAGAAMIIVAVLAGIPALGFRASVPVGLADDSGLRHLSPHHGSQRGIASPGRFVRDSRRRRDRRNPGSLSFDPGHGQFAHRMAALANLRRKAQVRTAQRIFFPARTRPRSKLVRITLSLVPRTASPQNSAGIKSQLTLAHQNVLIRICRTKYL